MSLQVVNEAVNVSHLQIAESVWDPVKRHTHIRILHNGGRAEDPAVAERLRRLARSILRRCAPEEIVAHDPSWRLLNAWPYGDVSQNASGSSVKTIKAPITPT